MKQGEFAAGGVNVVYGLRPSAITKIPVGVYDVLDQLIKEEVETDTFNAFDLGLTDQDVLDLISDFEFHQKTGRTFSCATQTANKVMYALAHQLSCNADSARDKFLDDLEV